ncbi:DUF6163 family protein [Microvirga flavescens]|uniref:DUF6163 family protein n=1 Tax=Microvirga flavescens TaxID=2249811 RepID=UPI000DDA8EB6|nr:DUF6163 family protein [Microvirga flavescens]
MALSLLPRRLIDASKEKLSDAIQEKSATAATMRWSFVLTWFMRILAVLWIMKGLSAWAVILGAWTPAGLFEARSTGYQATIVYFAVIDLIAAVGLWMASAWGGVMWLLAVMSQLILAAFFPRIVATSPLMLFLSMAFIATYLAISWLVAREEQRSSQS